MQNANDSNFRADFDNFTLTEQSENMSAQMQQRLQFQGAPVTSGPISYT
jgi:hypothetical protein